MTAITTRRISVTFAALLLAGVAGLSLSSQAAEEARAIPAFASDTQATPQADTEVAVLAGGCFWGVQGVFQHVKGVTSAVSGYAGGEKDTAVYQVVGRGTTRHAEAVKVTFDPRQISYAQILQIYFSVAHDPTQLNRQGPDSGTQYRSAIFPASPEQAKVAEAYIAQLDQAKAFDKTIATKIEGAKPFYPAEAYHQDYLTLNPRQPYIVFNDLPKIENLKRIFPAVYREDPVLVTKRSS
jgi:peptide-methionine (S)-S-oxide reductase